jgi:hypothetical protein
LVVSVCIRSKEATWYGRGGEAAQLGAREKEGEEGMRWLGIISRKQKQRRSDLASQHGGG